MGDEGVRCSTLDWRRVSVGGCIEQKRDEE